MKAAVVGGSGYLGAELLRLLAAHPEMEVALVQASGAAGSKVTDRYPGLSGRFGELVYDPVDPAACEGSDVVFVAVPTPLDAAGTAPSLVGRSRRHDSVQTGLPRGTCRSLGQASLSCYVIHQICFVHFSSRKLRRWGEI